MKPKHLFISVLIAAALFAGACGGDDSDSPPTTTEPTTTQAIEETPTTTPPTETDELSLETVVYEYLAEDPPPTLTDENLRCVADAVVGSLTPERAVEVAAVLADGSAPLGIPISALIDEEVDLIAASVEPCLDWATVIAESFAFEGADSDALPGLLECYTAAAQADTQFDQVSLSGRHYSIRQKMRQRLSRLWLIVSVTYPPLARLRRLRLG